MIYKSLSGHFEDLRLTLLKIIAIIALGICSCWLFSIELFAFIIQPLQHSSVKLIATSPMEGFFISLKLSFYAGLILTSPLWMLVLTQFLMPALKKSERRFVIPVFLTLFVAGGTTLFFSIQSLVPLANTFFADYNITYAENLWSISSYVGFVITLSLSLLLGSQLIGLFFLMVHFRVFNFAQLKEHRKKGYLAAFILGALLTPPDVPSQVMMAACLISFFELFLLYAKLRSNR